VQLHLEICELNFLANALLQHTGEPFESLLQMVLARDLRFDSDELDALSDLLAAERATLKADIAKECDGVSKGRMLSSLELLERVQERVNEACVMF